MAPTVRPSLLTMLHLRDDTAMPMYQQLEDQLSAHIEDGTLPVGAVLPSERQLADSLGISRITVQRAYNGLRERQLVHAQGRKGVLVQGKGPRLHPRMDRLKGFTEEMQELGKRPSSRILERRVVNDRSISSIFAAVTMSHSRARSPGIIWQQLLRFSTATSPAPSTPSSTSAVACL
jgi:GntR family transcriptional regulator